MGSSQCLSGAGLCRAHSAHQVMVGVGVIDSLCDLDCMIPFVSC